MKNYRLALIPIILSAIILIGIRLNTPPQQPARLIGSLETITRGHDLTTTEGERKDYVIVGTHLKLAEKSSLTLEDASTSVPRLALREGRIVTLGPIDITVRNTTVHADGTATFVFYSWLDKLEVHSLTGSVSFVRNGQTIQAPPDFTLDTLKDGVSPVVISPADPTASSAKDFYDWALN